MNIRHRFTFLALTLFVMMALVSGVFAQDTFGLGEEDFGLLAAANANSTNFDSLDYSFESELFIDVGDGQPVSMTLSGSGAIGVSANAFNMVLTGNLEGLGPIDMELRVVDDAVYVNGIDPSIGWVSITESEFNTLSDTFSEELPFDPAALAQGDTSELPLSEEAQQEIFGSMMTLDPMEFFALSREADLDGEAVFVAEVLLDALADSDFTTALVAAGIQSSDATVTWEDAKIQAAGVMGMGAAMLEDSELSFAQYIDPASQMVTAGDLTIALGGEGMPFTVDFFFDITIEEYNPVVSISAPETSTPLSDVLAAAGIS